MAAYLLLSLHKLSRLEEGFSLMKWLSQQRNYLGGYSSTQVRKEGSVSDPISARLVQNICISRVTVGQ
jgi:hypothetical protein